jgi:hypothetical protein
MMPSPNIIFSTVGLSRSAKPSTKYCEMSWKANVSRGGAEGLLRAERKTVALYGPLVFSLEMTYS